jgi:hypothetical protein
MITEASKDPDYVANIRAAGNDPWLIAPDKIADHFKADAAFWEADFKAIEPQ